MQRWDRAEGCPYPLGASWIADASALNFAVYSKHARQVTLLFFQEGTGEPPAVTVAFDPLRNKSGPIWHCRVSGEAIAGSRFYAYQIAGPEPGPGHAWHCFAPEKLLLDPYAQSVFLPPTFSRAAAVGPASNLGRAPLGVLPPRSTDAFDWGEDRRPRHDSDLVIYEMHVGGFTKNPNSGVADDRRGTFAGVIDRIPHLKELGITAVELMPVFQFDPQEANYWGYMPLSFFAPHHAYAGAGDAGNAFRAMVRELHRADIEVILDVVYNHTTEGDSHGPIYSLKGVDNTSYYMLNEAGPEPYANFSGTGNSLHTANRAVRRLIIDSLQYWVSEMHVDGFRFDLASVFTRNPDGSIGPSEPPIFGEIAAHPELADIRLIAEPWDARGLFQLGQRFPGTLWRQWNAAFRDGIQRFVRGDDAMVPEMMARLYGSRDLFPDDLEHANHPYQSINYVTSHDGFTLYDLVSYEQKNNWANGLGNTDGPNDFSWNCGHEGVTSVAVEAEALRKRQVKNFFCLLMLSNGTPMFRMGDEMLQTQFGNNNPFNQDNETSWLDWSRLETHRDVHRFFRQMIAFRKRHYSLSRSRFWRGDVAWYGPQRSIDLSPKSRQLAFFLRGATEGDADIYVMVNADSADLSFGIHDLSAKAWKRVVDTALESPADIVDTGQEINLDAMTYLVRGRSTVVLLRA